MNPLLIMRIATRALLRNKMRSFLTTLGIIIGVAAVIAMVAIGEGAKARVEETFASMGSNLLMLMPGSSSRGGSFGGFGSLPTITWDDLDAIRAEASDVRYVAATLRSSGSVASEDLNWTTQIYGTSPDYFLLRSWKTKEGAAFTDSDVEGGVKVVMLGQTVVEKIYGSGFSPVGSMVRINNVPFQVVAVLEKKGQSPIGQDFDDSVFMPESTFQAKVQGGLQKFIAGGVMIGATAQSSTARAQEQVRAILRDRHYLQTGQEDDFSIRDLSEMANAQQEGTNTLTTLLASIAAVSLLVGGIGIMNIMLVSVTERTREIGVRMAVGAKSHHILAQFLAEALTLSIAGGIIGVGLGLFAGQKLAESFGWPMLIRTDIIVVSVAFSALVGVGFGLYPARKASQLDPIEALRYE